MDIERAIDRLKYLQLDISERKFDVQAIETLLNEYKKQQDRINKAIEYIQEIDDRIIIEHEEIEYIQSILKGE